MLSRSAEHQLEMSGIHVVAMHRILAIDPDPTMNMLCGKRHSIAGLTCEMFRDRHFLSRIAPDGKLFVHTGVGNLGTYSYSTTSRVAAEVLVLAALGAVLQERRGLDRDEYAARHPAGALGKQARGK